MSDLRFTANVELQAGAEGKPAKVSIMAYSGGAMDVVGFGPVAIELAGLTLPQTIPLLGDHISSLEGVAGSGSPSVVNGSLHVNGTLASNETGKRIIALSHDNVPLQASVGVSPAERIGVKAGDIATVNGKKIKAGPRGLTIVKSGALREVSILPLGADPSTSVAIAAARKGKIMGDDEITEVVPVEEERSRVREIVAICRGEHQDIQAKAIDEGWTADATAGHVLTAVRSGRFQPSRAVPNRSPSRSATGLEAIEASLLIRTGREALAVKAYGEEVTEAARHMRSSSLIDLCGHVLRLGGQDTGGMSRGELVKAAFAGPTLVQANAGFSTLSLPNAFANVMGKTLLDSYTQSTASWRGFAKVSSSADFKPQAGIRPSFTGSLEILPKAGEFKHGLLAESPFPWKVDTYGKMFTVDRQDVINDDLGFLDQVPTLLAKAAARAINDLVWRTILANAGAFFSTTHKNLISGTGSALTSAGLRAAVTALRSQRDEQNNDIQIEPAILAVPPELESTAKALVTSEYVGQADTSEPTGNPWRGAFDVTVESRISNTAKFPNASATKWFLFGKPSDTPVIVGFLDGMQNPVVETLGFDGQVNVLALSFRCYHDFGAALGDWRAAVKSVGA